MTMGCTGVRYAESRYKKTGSEARFFREEKILYQKNMSLTRLFCRLLVDVNFYD